MLGGSGKEVYLSKWCGKTTTASQQAKSIIKMQDTDNAAEYLATAATKPSLLLRGENPRLIDEWQDAPNLWDAVRDTVDNRSDVGLYILTGGTMAYTRQDGVKIIPLGCLTFKCLNLRQSNSGTAIHSLEGAGRFVIGLAADVKILEGDALRKYILDYQKKYIQKL